MSDLTQCPYGAGDHRALIRQAKAEALREAAEWLRAEALLLSDEPEGAL